MVQNSKAKKPKQSKKAPSVSNGFNDSEQLPTVKNAATKNDTEKESKANTVPKVESEINGDQNNVVKPEASSNDARSATNSRTKKAAESAAETENTKTTVSEGGEETSTEPQSKTKGRPKKDKNSKMDKIEEAGDPCSSEEVQTEKSEEVSENPTTSRKRKATAEENESEKVDETETAEPAKRGRRAVAATTKKQEEAEQESAETVEPAKKSSRKKVAAKAKPEAAAEDLDEAEEESAEPTVPERKSRKRKIAEPVKTEEKSKRKDVKKSVPVTKAKKQKVLLSIPPATIVSGKVFVIGENDVGQLGFGEEVEVKKRPAMLELPHSITSIAAGGMHSVCLTESGEVITFGCNDEGALGRILLNDSEEANPGRVEIPERVIQISAGDSHTAALTESGQVYLWGNFRSGDGPMGLTVDGAKQVQPVRILTNKTIVKISSGTEHLACLSDEGAIYTCGCGQNGQLGRLNERLCRDGGRRGLASFLEPDVVPVRGLPSSRGKPVLIEDIWASSYSTFFKAQGTGQIYAFGLNNYNQLGYENEQVTYFPRQVASFDSSSWKEISGGQHHTLCLDNEGLVSSMGRSDYGRLGLGENSGERSSPTLITSLDKEKCSNISCGNCVSFAVTEGGSLYSWGFGTNHQLGHGNDDDCHVPRLVEGNFANSWKAIKVSGGGQHTLVLAIPRESTKGDTKK